MSKHFENLLSQLERLRRHNRQGSFRTRARYYEAMKRFCRFAAEQYRLERLANLAPKHIYAYVDFLKASGKSPSTIKTDLAAIRFFHDLIPNPRYELPGNQELFLTRRTFGEVDRTWSNVEFNKMLGKALAEDRYDYILALYLARYAGLRIHECFRIDTATTEKALREKTITVKGKGGKMRTVPINEQIAIALREQLERKERGCKLLVPGNMPTHQAINHLQGFIFTHRAEIQDEGSTRPMTFHGLRHTYAAETYKKLIESGMNELDAHFAVSRLLGHERPDVTNIYLASLPKGARHGK